VTSFLNDIVLDEKHTDDEGNPAIWAYISDTGRGLQPSDGYHGGLLVYNFQTNTARRILDSHYSVQPVSNYWIHINGDGVLSSSPLEAGADGIALLPDASLLVYCALTSTILYSLPTDLLRNFSTPLSDIEASVALAYNKNYASDGISFANNNALYTTSLEKSAIIEINLNNGTVNVIAQDSVNMVWPDTIGFDHKGNLLFVTNKLYKFWQGLMDFTQTNFRIWKVYIGAGSYLDPI